MLSLHPDHFGPYANFKQEFDSKFASGSLEFADRDRLFNTAMEVSSIQYSDQESVALVRLRHLK